MILNTVRDIIAEWANEEGISFAETERLDARLAAAEENELPVDMMIKEAVDAAIVATNEACAEVAESRKIKGDSSHSRHHNGTCDEIAGIIRARIKL
jgi:hypothetical protein